MEEEFNKNEDIAISVDNITKKFLLYEDKAYFLKERLTNLKRNKKEYHVVLEDVSCNIKKGETVGLIGVNGSGKSTFLKLLTKIIYPEKGKIDINGKVSSLLELGAGFNIDFTGRENIYFNSSIYGLGKKDVDKVIDKIIEFSELGEYIDTPVRTYSSGMYMRLAFSVAINVEADILLIDEILSVGDSAFQKKCEDKLIELKNSNKTIVFVSHSMGSVENLCSRAIWFKDAKIQKDGIPKEVIKEYFESQQLQYNS